MRIYDVTYANGNSKTFYNLNDAKKEIKNNPGSKGFITKIYNNGDWEPIGEIKIKGCNASCVVGATRQTIENYN